MLDFVIGYSMGAGNAGRMASLARSSGVADASRHTQRVEDLNERIDKLLIIIRGMWELMEEQGFKPEDLVAKIEQLDMMDGVSDGVARQGALDCPSCESKVAPGLANCQFCGAEIMLALPDDPIGHL